MKNMENNKEQTYIEERLSSFEEELDTLIANIGITLNNTGECNKVLNFTFEDLTNLDSEQCAIYQIQLEQYALYVQQLTNRSYSIQNWINHNMNVIFGKEIQNIGTQYTKFEEKKICFIQNNSYATALNKQLLTITSKCIELNSLSSKISQIASSLSNLGKTKSWIKQANQN